MSKTVHLRKPSVFVLYFLVFDSVTGNDMEKVSEITQLESVINGCRVRIPDLLARELTTKISLWEKLLVMLSFIPLKCKCLLKD